VDPKSTELASEQAYFDVAHKHRERRRAELGEVPTAAANAGAASRLRFWVKAKKEAAPAPDSAVAFGRIDDESDKPVYIGNELIMDEDHDALVVNWKTPAAARYYEATHADPHGLVRKRSFATTSNVITDFEDVVFAQLAADVMALDGADPFLLAELDTDRTGTLRGIVATIHAAQYELIRAPLDQVLVIEGGPGTGKTVVALHRVSWLLFNHRDRLTAADVLVVGPQPAFTRYIRNVLPDTGDVDVVQQDIGQLAPPVPRGRSEPAEVRRLKGDARMAGLLRRALEARIGTPEAAERLLFDGRYVTLSGDEVAALVAAAREAPGGYAQRRRLLRDTLLDLVRERGAPTGRDRLVPLENLVDRLWPQLSPAAFLRGLLGSRPRLAAAAGDEFTADELALLHRRGADRLSREVWSAGDLPLLDEVEDLISGVPAPYRHIVVDEAQDLSPMQLRSIARRSATGSCTVVGDLAQSTGPWARDRWDEVVAHLPATLPHSVATLRYGYRVPRQVYELAATLLPVAAPDASPLTVVRDGPAAPGIHRVDAGSRAGRAVGLARSHAEAGRFVGLVCPPACRAEVEDALSAEGVTWSGGELDAPVNLVAPAEAKGLEFDAVVVVEPEEIVAGDERGHRMLFMALTRTTRYLDIVCVGEPVPLAAPQRVPRPRTEPDPPADPTQLDGLAREIATIVLSGAPAPLWDEVLHRAAGILDRQADRTASSGRHRRD
jgi:DNA helicase IV